MEVAKDKDRFLSGLQKKYNNPLRSSLIVRVILSSSSDFNTTSSLNCRFTATQLLVASPPCPVIVA